MTSSDGCRVLVFGAHPDDAEVFAGGLVVRHCRQGSVVRIVSVTDGQSGHHELSPDELIPVRRAEAKAAGTRVGASYDVWDFPDGQLTPSIEVRNRVIREIREFEPDLVLTHRPNDYHPDHRAVGTAVQDASYLVTVPNICRETPALRNDPVVAYMCDLFTRPNPMRPDILLDVAPEFDLAVQMAACHQSQFFECLPFHDGILDTVPNSPAERFEWLCEWFSRHYQERLQHFRDVLVQHGWPLGAECKLEVYEVSEYAGKLAPERKQQLFPGS